MTVRRAGLGDEPILRALRLEALSEAPEAFGSTYERELARTTADWQRWLAPGITLILEQSGEARGLVAGMLDADDSTVANLMAMWIHPALRGSGAADSLVAGHVAWARGAGARSVRIQVFTTNDRARRLYERHGFRPTGQQTARDDGRTELQMELPLEGASTSTDANVAALSAAVAHWNAGHLEGYLALYDPEAVLEGYAGVGPGLSGIRQFYEAFWGAFPGCRLVLEDVLASGEKVACRVRLEGEHRGPFRGIAATGSRIEVPGLTILEFRSGKCIHRWSCMDSMGLLRQLGAFPSR